MGSTFVQDQAVVGVVNSGMGTRKIWRSQVSCFFFLLRRSFLFECCGRVELRLFLTGRLEG